MFNFISYLTGGHGHFELNLKGDYRNYGYISFVKHGEQYKICSISLSYFIKKYNYPARPWNQT